MIYPDLNDDEIEAEEDRQSDEAYAEYLAAMESEAQAGDPKW